MARKTYSILLSSLFFTILQPGLVTALIPYWILGSQVQRVLHQHYGWQQYLGLVLIIPGLFILLDCIIGFALEGKGTLSPADPTKKLVIQGLYKYSRNPMYIGVMLMLIGEAIFFEAGRFWWYVLMVGVMINLFIIFIEEPRLRKDFGDAYILYCQQVNRWVGSK